MFSKIVTVFGSRMKAFEIVLLLADAKMVVRQGFYSHELEHVRVFCKDHHIFLTTSPFTVTLGSGRFVDEGRVGSNPEDMTFAYFSKDEKNVLLACLYETQQDHTRLGLLLGYPACCVRFFEEKLRYGVFNPVHTPATPWTNLTRREDDAVLLSHFPCRSDCVESVALARRYYGVLRMTDPDVASDFLNLLSEHLSFL